MCKFKESQLSYEMVLKCIFMVLLVVFSFDSALAEEMYIITTRNGSEIIVKNYRFTEEHVEFTTGNDLPGFIKREEFVKISNMVGVPPAPAVQAETIDDRKEKEMTVWLGSAATLIVLYLLFLLYVIKKKKSRKEEEGEVDDVYHGRSEKDLTTQGHLAFLYRDSLGRKSDWVIEVRKAYEQDNMLFVEGITTETGKHKTFRADRIEGLVTDVSSERKAPIHKFFIDADEKS